MKKFMAIMLALVLVLGMATTASAASITVSGAVNGETYNAYKIFDVTASGNNYSYTITNTTGADWFDVVVAYMSVEADATGVYEAKGLTLTPSVNDKNVYVVTNDETNGLDAAEFAAYLIANKGSLAADGGPVEAANDTAAFSDLEAGYYLIDSSLGALCALDTATAEVTVYEKNTKPSIEKKVWEDSISAWGDAADADKGDEVDFQLTVNTGKNAAYIGNTDDSATLGNGIDGNYVITDTLPTNMTLVDEEEAEGVAAVYEDIKVTADGATWTEGTDYTVDYTNNVLTITLVYSYVEGEGDDAVTKYGKLASLDQESEIVITYSATLDAGAKVATPETNKVVLEYKEQDTVEDTTDVYTWEVDVFKFANVTTGEGESATTTETPLADAKFVLTDESQKKYYKLTDDGLVDWVDSVDAATALITGTDGHLYTIGDDGKATTTSATFTGLDSDIYFLIETEAPAGYNLLSAPVLVVIEVASADYADNTLTHKVNSQADLDNDGTSDVKIENKTGSELPSTGGMGTTIFYVVGGMMMAAAFVLLITRRKVASDR